MNIYEMTRVQKLNVYTYIDFYSVNLPYCRLDFPVQFQSCFSPV